LSNPKTGRRPKRGGPRTGKLRRRAARRHNVRQRVQRVRKTRRRLGLPRWWRAALLVLLGGLVGFSAAVFLGYRHFADRPGPSATGQVAIS